MTESSAYSQSARAGRSIVVLLGVLAAAASLPAGTASHFDIIEHNGEITAIKPVEELDLPARWFFEPDTAGEAPYRVRIAGEAFPLVAAGFIEPAYYARFQIKEPFTLEIEVDLPEDYTTNLQPKRYREDLSGSEGALRLEINEPGPRVFMMESADGGRRVPLIVLAEPYRSWEVAGPGLFLDVSAAAEADSLETETLQEAMDTVAAAEDGGVVYFGPGVYHTRQLRVGPNTRVFLAPGAVVYADTDYDGRHRPLFLFDEADNSGLTGPGVIDGRGHIIRGDAPGRAPASFHLVRFQNGRNMYASDVVLRNSSAWTFHIVGCDRVQVDGVRVLADWGVRHTDGIDPDNVRDVEIANVFVYSGDDALCVKTTDRYGSDARPTRNVTMRDSVVMSLKTPLKVGTESSADIENILFENIDVIHSARGLGVWMRDGTRFNNITFRSIRIDALEFEGESMSGEAIRFCIQHRLPGGSIKNIVVEDVSVSAPYRAIFTGREGSRFSNIILRDIDWKVTPTRIKTPPEPVTLGWVTDRENELPIEGRPLVAIHRVNNLLAENVTIDWSKAPDSWDRFLDKQESTNIDLKGVTHEGYPFH